MTYVTQAQLELLMSTTVIAELTDDSDGDTPAIVAGVVTEIIELSTGIINGYIQPRFNITSLDDTTSLILKRAAVDICRYYLWSRRKIPDDVQKAYDSTLDMLEKMGRGEVLLGSTETTEVSNTAIGTRDSRADNLRKYTDNNLSNY